MCKYKKIIEKRKDAFYCELKHDLDWLPQARICEGCEHNADTRTVSKISVEPIQ